LARRITTGAVRVGDPPGGEVVGDPVDPAARVDQSRLLLLGRSSHCTPIQAGLRVVRTSLPGQGRVELTAVVFVPNLALHTATPADQV
jgi:hypothetical protein